MFVTVNYLYECSRKRFSFLREGIHVTILSRVLITESGHYQNAKSAHRAKPAEPIFDRATELKNAFRG